MRRCNVGPYPANFLAFGSPQPQFFHYNLFTAIEVPLVRRHPVTSNEIPGTASHWSVAGRTVRFRLNAAAALLHAAEPGFYAEFGSDYRKRYAHRCRSHGSGIFTVARCAEMVLIIAKCYLRLTRRASQAEFKVRKYSVETCGLNRVGGFRPLTHHRTCLLWHTAVS